MATFLEIFNSIVPDENGCMIWPGKRAAGAYPVHLKKRTHQTALALKLGRPIAPGMMALHTCDRKSCVAPDHLYEGTAAQNIADMAARHPTWRESLRAASTGHVHSEDQKKKMSQGRLAYFARRKSPLTD